MSTPTNPLASADPTQGLMQQAQSSLNNPMAQAVPQAGGNIDPSIHPLIAKLISGIAQAAQAYGWTGSTPQERLERTQMEQQKAETMARMAQTGAYQQGELETRKQQADTAADRAKSYAADVASKNEARQTQADINQQKLELAKEANEWKKDIASGRLDQAKQRMSNQAAQFEKTFQLRAQQVGIEQAKLELAQQGMGIKQGFLDLAGAALNQKGTAEGLNTITKLQSIAFEHPILSQIFGLDDVTKAVGESRGSGMPGVTPGAPAAAGPTAPLPAPMAPNKVDIKRNQRTPKPVAPQFHYDAAGNRIAGPAQ